jgi:Rrf2 family protein
VKLSTKGRYGLRALVDLIIHYEGDSVPLSTIATRQNISVNYLEQVFGSLRRAGMVRTIKGAQGGYNLMKDPKEITVGDVLRAIEGDIIVVEEEINETAPTSVQNMQKCIQNKVWDQMNKSIQNVINEITLDQLAKEYIEKNPKDPIMYYI